MGEKLFWFDARNIKDYDNVISFMNSKRFKDMVIRYDMYETMKEPYKMRMIVEVDKDCDWKTIDKTDVIMSRNEELLKEAQQLGYQTAFLTFIANGEEMDMAWKMGQVRDYLVVELTDETNIPIELLIAKLQKSDCKLLKIVHTAESAKICLGVMESGCNGVVIQTENLNEIKSFDDLMSMKEKGNMELVKAKVTKVQHIDMGYRVCIDTTTLMNQTEGMIIGSTSRGGFLVSSETHYLPYMQLRPFRVNAGAVHSYVWIPDNMTGYLTELKSGTKVLCVNTDGETREVSVGRVKMELRPLLLIEGEYEGIKISVIVQDDWHIRIFGGEGEVRNASTIRVGDALLAYVCEAGRHVGVKIDECLIEK